MRTAVTLGAVGLVVLPLLAVVVFGMASRMARPVLALTTTVTALEGSQFRPASTAEVARRDDLFGALARALEVLASDTAATESTLRQETEELRKARHVARRQKIVFRTHKPEG